MRQIVIGQAEQGQRLDKYLSRYMPEAPKSFFYKMLRKKNITCNRKKCDGSEKLCAGDCIELFLAEETIEKFRGSQKKTADKLASATGKINIIYEDDDILLIDKQAGELSQKASPQDVSIVEKVIEYAISTGKIREEQLSVCKPSVCNRLDRNTSGLIAAGLSIRGLQFLSEQFRKRELHKYYMTLVKGAIYEKQQLKGFLYKNEKDNKVEIHTTLEEFSKERQKEALAIETVYEPVAVTEEATLLKVLLVTGRSHQIRAHLASISHPIIGDSKYGDAKVNESYRKAAGTKRQLLHAYEMVFPKCTGEFSYMSDKSFKAKLPGDIKKAMKVAGIQEWTE